MATDQKFSEYRVNSLPNSGLQAGDRYYLSVGGGKYKTFIVSDNLVLTGDAGAEFIEKDTMAQMRALSSREIWALQNGYYKGVRLSGYYTKGDTPAPIVYTLSETTDEDDGGSVIEVGGIKLEHDFSQETNIKYFGAIGNGIIDNKQFINNAILKAKKVNIDDGDYAVSIVEGGYGGGGIVLQNGSILNLSKEAIIRVISGDSKVSNLLGIAGKQNVKIDGGIFIGDKNTHLTPEGTYWKPRQNSTAYSVGEYIYINTWGFIVETSGTSGSSAPSLTGASVGTIITDGSSGLTLRVTNSGASGSSTSLGERAHGLWVNNSKNITIRDSEFREFWGDGIYLGGSSTATFKGAENVTITNVTCDDNRRQGMSIVQGENINVTNSSFNNTSGTNPRAGIDIEPNDATQYVKNVVIDGCNFIGNEGSGVEFATINSGPYIDTVRITKCVFNQCRIDVSGNSSYTSIRNVSIDNNDITLNNRDSALRFTRCSNSTANNNRIIRSGGTIDNFGIHVRDNCSGIKILNNYTDGWPTVSIYVDDMCSDITILNNTGGNTGNLIRIRNTSNFICSNNHGYNLNTRGIWVGASTDGTIQGNDFKLNNSGQGITLDVGCVKNTVKSNTIINPASAGIAVITDSTQNTIINNTIISSGTTLRGIDLLNVTGINIVGLNNYIGTFTSDVQRLSSTTVLFPLLSQNDDASIQLQDGASTGINKIALTSKPSATTPEPNRVLKPFYNTSDNSSGYPSAAGGGILFQRGDNTNMGAFMLYKSNNNISQFYLVNVGAGVSFPIQIVSSGATANRPTTGLFVGKIYFDTTLGYNITWNGTDWVDSTGTVV